MDERRIDNVESQLEVIWRRIDELKESQSAIKTGLIEIKAQSSEQIRILREISDNGLRQCVVCSADVINLKTQMVEMKSELKSLHEVKYAVRIISWLGGIIGSGTIGLIIKALSDLMHR